MKKKLLILLGSLSLFLGLLGIALPLLPTTPFLLLSATCYFHGSDKLYRWLMTHPTLGPYIHSFRESESFLSFWIWGWFCVAKSPPFRWRKPQNTFENLFSNVSFPPQLRQSHSFMILRITDSIPSTISEYPISFG